MPAAGPKLKIIKSISDDANGLARVVLRSARLMRLVPGLVNLVDLALRKAAHPPNTRRHDGVACLLLSLVQSLGG